MILLESEIRYEKIFMAAVPGAVLDVHGCLRCGTKSKEKALK